jgi:hypothetical protein
MEEDWLVDWSAAIELVGTQLISSHHFPSVFSTLQVGIRLQTAAVHLCVFRGHAVLGFADSNPPNRLDANTFFGAL